MYDYVDGKVEWMAQGHPVEGEDGPFIGSVLSQVATCDVGLTVDDARRAPARADHDLVIVVRDGMAVGEVGPDELDGKDDGAPLLEVLAPVPSTVRPDVPVSALEEAGGGSVLVTTSSGHLLGLATVEGNGNGRHHDHDHDG